MNQPLSSTNLLQLARRGDSESLAKLLRSYFRYLNKLSQDHLDDRVRIRESPSDVVQETMLEAHRDFDAFAGTTIEEFTGWIRKILFNNLANTIERHVITFKRDVRKQCPIESRLSGADRSAVNLLEALNDQATSISSAAQQKELLEQLRSAIHELSDDHRDVIQMRHFKGMSFNDIAEKLDRNPGATRMLWLRAVEKLKDHFKDED